MSTQNKSIKSFSGKNEFLSNFAPSVLEFDGIVYKTAEHAYQAAKAVDLDDKLVIARLKTPGQAKRAGKTVSLRRDWEQVKLSVMTNIVREKFLQNPDLAIRLIATDDAHLEEGNDWRDQFWGTVKGIGENHLGKILMKIRDELKGGDLTSKG